MRIENSVVIVTGGSRGIGRAVTEKLLERGASVMAIAKTSKSVKQMKKEIDSDNFDAITCDVSDPDQAGDAVITCRRRFGRIDALVNNAGVGVFKPIEDMSLYDWDYQLNTNLRGAFLISQAVYREMLGTGGGEIVHVASNLGYTVREKAGAYCASKWGLVGLSKTMNAEGRAHGIRVSTVSPGLVQTDFSGVSAAEKTDGLLPGTVADHILGALEASEDTGEIEVIIRP
ncbi:SDR family oxidoreductase [Alkalicoccus urumqiensis]|uniref:SDR family oxidoreductase n=1 Tax=Alkalicoccus urumqiensis TaxID=1548213 RepID=UPI0015E5E6C0|nr:SDR family oxidoreductase [Alkalicoccus urumqiensis]